MNQPSPKSKLTVAACLIVKNESAMIRRCLESLRYLDEIVILDTGSEDKTCELIREWAALYPEIAVRLSEGEFTWCDNFAEARNRAAEQVQSDWILVIDADEVLSDGSTAFLRNRLPTVEGNTLSITVRSEDGHCEHGSVRLYRPGRGVRYQGEIHETLTPSGSEACLDAAIIFGHSPAHALDPDRSLRILLKHRDACPRNLYYLAREYWYRADYETAIPIFIEHTLKSTHWAEVADSHLYLARMLWMRQRGGEARVHCLKAIGHCPDWREALEFMALISWPEQAEKWRQYAKLATNKGVLFVRG